jgi:proline iminopeptidase
MIKENIKDDVFNITVAKPKKSTHKYVLFVHGGPGSNSSIFEEYITKNKHYKKSNIGWVIYDQRGCGKSKKIGNISHTQNIEDLKYIKEKLLNMNICAIAGHSYGAWLTYEYSKIHNNDTPIILLGMSNDINEPRNKSIEMDLAILQSNQPSEYLEAKNILSRYPSEKWKAARKIRKLLKNSSLRDNYYWHDKDVYAEVSKLKQEMDFRENTDIFQVVRDDLYSKPERLVGPKRSHIENKLLWINGSNDYLMRISNQDIENENILTFEGSAHYPHLEQPDKFIKEIEGFLA